MLKIGDNLWHPCSVDIIKHAVVGIHQYETHVEYSTKACNNVGACGRVECLIRENKKGKLIFVELIKDSEYADGLWDFVEGEYFRTENEARLVYYSIILTQLERNVSDAKFRLEKEKFTLEKVRNIIKTLS